MDFANIVLTVTLSVIALIAIIVRSVKTTIRSVLVEEGITRPHRPGEKSDNWPNGWRNLPDALEGIHNIVTEHMRMQSDDH